MILIQIKFIFNNMAQQNKKNIKESAIWNRWKHTDRIKLMLNIAKTIYIMKQDQ